MFDLRIEGVVEIIRWIKVRVILNRNIYVKGVVGVL